MPVTPTDLSNSSSSDSDTPLGKTVEYPSVYAPQLLFAIARDAGRAELDYGSVGLNVLPFTGEDLWTAYEISG
jgi:7-cyano-7-deazaguanine reductase